jgi:hypothetical protein|tara:strand:+ start:41 stop:445 length:405 start_codon:yes stop_codon:yes gene_type:complete
MADPILIGSEIKSIPGIDNAKQIYAFRDNDTTSVRALHDDSGSDYQVPVGRKTLIFQCYFGYGTSSAGRAEFRIWGNNAIAAAGDLKYYGAVSNYQAAIYPQVYMEFAAGEYIVHEPTGSNPVNTAVIGVEIDA